MLALRIIATVLLGLMILFKIGTCREGELIAGILLAIPDVFAIIVIWVI